MRFLSFFLFVSVQLIAQPGAIFDSLQVYHSDTLYFASGQAELTADAQQKLDLFPARTATDQRVYLTGHTDAIGSAAYNEDLARRRAAQAAQVLLEKGWSDSTLVVRTFGERTPVAGNDTDTERRRNRRVTIDAYRPVPYRQFSGRVVNPKDRTPIPNAQIRIHSRSFSDTLRTDDQGGFLINLAVDSVVGFDVFARGYFLDSKMIRITPKTLKELTFELDPAKPGEVATIDNFFFVGNKAVLLKKSKPELPKLLRFMQINPHLKIEIAGHVNLPFMPPIGEDNPSWGLSERRAKMVYDYLVENGIPAEQMRYQAYGNHQMIYPKAQSESRQAANRRVEIRILAEMEEE